MTQAGYRHRIIIQDRSASMNDILAGAQSGLDEFIEAEGKAAPPGKVTFSIWDFDTEIRCVHSFEGADAVRGYQIRPRGNTALYDAAGMAVTAEGRNLAGLPEGERPEDVVVIIASDGRENSSQKWEGPQVAALLAQQQDVYKWRVLYMGCKQDAFAEGAKIGTRQGLTVNTASTNSGQENAWKMSSDYLGRVPVAAATMDSLDLTDEERARGESK
jgi:hypothetical protein